MLIGRHYPWPAPGGRGVWPGRIVARRAIQRVAVLVAESGREPAPAGVGGRSSGGCVHDREMTGGEPRSRTAGGLREMLDWAVTQSPVHVALLDTDLRQLRLNTAMCRVLGLPDEAAGLGLRLTDLEPNAEAEACLACARQVIETGEPGIWRGFQPSDGGPGPGLGGHRVAGQGPGRPGDRRAGHLDGRDRAVPGQGAAGAAQRGQHPDRQHPGRDHHRSRSSSTSPCPGWPTSP